MSVRVIALIRFRFAEKVLTLSLMVLFQSRRGSVNVGSGGGFDVRDAW